MNLMSNFLSKKLISLNIKKGLKQNSLANYKPYVIDQNLVFISGQLPIKEQVLLFSGKVGESISVEDTKNSIRMATYNLLWVLSDAMDEYKNVKQIFIGKSSSQSEMARWSGGYGKKFDGNSILIEIKDKQYCYIGDLINEFTTKSIGVCSSFR